MIEKTNDNAGFLSTSYGFEEFGNSTVFVKNNVLIFNNLELLNALDATTKSALKALVNVGAAQIPEGAKL